FSADRIIHPFLVGTSVDVTGRSNSMTRTYVVCPTDARNIFLADLTRGDSHGWGRSTLHLCLLPSSLRNSTSFLAAARHKRTVPAQLAVARVVPSGEKATVLILASCQRRVSR